MATTIVLLNDPLNIISSTDWLEMNALIDSDRSTSIEDLISPLRARLSITDEKIEGLRADISAEIIRRAEKIGSAYPFSFNGKLLRLKEANQALEQWTYIFCLMISCIGLETGQKKMKLWRIMDKSSLFEDVSTIAAKNYLSNPKSQAEALKFGAPRRLWPRKYRSFPTALSYLTTHIGEGRVKEIPHTVTMRKQDGGLDLIAWRSFPDNRANKIFLLGQCAAGKDFRSKQFALRKFNQFFELQVGVIPALFVPHEINNDDWIDLYSPDTGMIFDRSRISLYAQEWDGSGFKENFQEILDKIRSYYSSI